MKTLKTIFFVGLLFIVIYILVILPVALIRALFVLRKKGGEAAKKKFGEVFWGTFLEIFLELLNSLNWF